MKSLNKVMVIGCCGAGKSTFSKKLNAITFLDIIHLDQYYWKDNWIETPREEWTEIVKKLSKKKQWIIEGNYAGTMDIRIEQADTIIYLDYSTLKCLWRITTRIFRYWRQQRPDMTAGCKERFDFDFYRFVATFNLKNRKKLTKKLQQQKNSKSIFIFKNDRMADDFLNQCKVTVEANVQAF